MTGRYFLFYTLFCALFFCAAPVLCLIAPDCSVYSQKVCNLRICYSRQCLLDCCVGLRSGCFQSCRIFGVVPERLCKVLCAVLKDISLIVCGIPGFLVLEGLLECSRSIYITCNECKEMTKLMVNSLIGLFQSNRSCLCITQSRIRNT